MTTTTDPPFEIIHDHFPQGHFHAAIFDFDGTLSLLRRNWQDVMIPMMVAELERTGTPESPDALYQCVEEFVMRLNGRQTIYQMLELVNEVKRRGGIPQDPLIYKQRYHAQLWEQVGERVAAVREGRMSREEMTVPGARALLDALSGRGVVLYLASGTDLTYVRDEASVLGLDAFFAPRIYGALDEYWNFSKAMIVRQIIDETGVAGSELMGIGDGFVEIEEIKKVGGLAIGVASNEDTREGINVWKRNRLVRAGADLIVPDYRRAAELLELIGL